jgi:hypothetical protein
VEVELGLDGQKKKGKGKKENKKSNKDSRE